MFLFCYFVPSDKSAAPLIAVIQSKFIFRHVTSCLLLCRAGEISSVYRVKKAVAQEIKAISEPAVRNGNVSVIVITGIILIIYMLIFWHKSRISPNCWWQKDQLNHCQWVGCQKNNVQCVTLSAYKHFIHLFVRKVSAVFHNNPKNQEEASAKLMISQGSSLSINYNFADILFQGTYEAAAPVERVLMPLGPMRFKMTV